MRYAKLNGTRLDYYGGSHICHNGDTIFNPTERTLLKCGYLPVPETRTDAPVTAWAIVDNALVPTYGEPTPPPPRTFSKLRIITAAKVYGVWERLKEFITRNDLTDEWQAAQDLRNDYPGFDALIDAVIVAGVATRAQAESILDQSEVR